MERRVGIQNSSLHEMGSNIYKIQTDALMEFFALNPSNIDAHLHQFPRKFTSGIQSVQGIYQWIHPTLQNTHCFVLQKIFHTNTLHRKNNFVTHCKYYGVFIDLGAYYVILKGATESPPAVKFKVLFSSAICCTTSTAEIGRDSLVGIAAGYGLDDRRVGVRALIVYRNFTSPSIPDRPWGSIVLPSDSHWRHFPRDKADAVWT